MLKAVIFDMDGVIIDSNQYIYDNWNSYFEKKYNITIPKSEFGLRLGESHKHFTQHFVDNYASGEDAEEIADAIWQRYLDSRHRIELKKGVEHVLKYLHSKRYRVALATGANKEAALHMVERFSIKKYFDYIIAGDEVNRAKPNPEIFLKAAQAIGVAPEKCVVIEDAFMGLKAAKAAGMKCIMVDDAITKEQDHSMADAKIKDLLMLPKKLEEL